MWINSRDLARFGHLLLRSGNWNRRQLVSAAWVKQATRRAERPTRPRLRLPVVAEQRGGKGYIPRSSYTAQGNGSNTIFVIPITTWSWCWRWHAGRDGKNDFYKRNHGRDSRELIALLRPIKPAPGAELAFANPQRGRHRCSMRRSDFLPRVCSAARADGFAVAFVLRRRTMRPNLFRG